MASEQDLITAHQLAAELNLSVDTIWRYSREKKIPHVELNGKQYRYRLADVLRALSGTQVNESTTEYNSGSGRKMTYADYCTLPEEPGYRYEVLDGVLVRDPSPNVPHQHAITELYVILREYFMKKDQEGKIFLAPLDVTLDQHNVIQPDLFYIPGSGKKMIKFERIDGKPVLVVEVISPSSGRKDRFQKMNIYQKNEIKHYWLLDPDQKTLECFELRDGLYSMVVGGMENDIVEHPTFNGLKIDLNLLWWR
ncbi:MAG: Uma2 family endonuclease [Dethiobacteria bacterium]